MPGVIVKLYNNSSDNRVVHKSISQIGTDRTCQISDECNIVNPRILLDAPGTYLSANYMYIPSFGRYYYIRNMNILNGNQVEIEGHCDVLMSFWNSIKNSQCTAGRSSSNYDDYIDDPMVTIKDTYRTESRRLSGEFTPTADGSNHYVLTIGGME
jgi:hypothetical protein